MKYDIFYRPLLLLELSRLCLELDLHDLAASCVDSMKNCVVKVLVFSPSKMSDLQLSGKSCLCSRWLAQMFRITFEMLETDILFVVYAL